MKVLEQKEKIEAEVKSGTNAKVSKLKWLAGGTAVSTVGKGCVNVCLRPI